jgi:hypothetical protein
MRNLRAFVVVGLVLLSVTTAAASDSVVYWNNAAGTYILVPARGPAGMLDYAKMHLAIHDAVQAYEDRYEPYCVDIANASGDPDAAVAAAAHGVLVSLFSTQAAAIDLDYQNYLFNNGLIGNAGIGVGEQAAKCIVTLRANDGAFPNPSPTFFGGTEPGQWRPTTVTNPPTSMFAPWFGAVTPFALTSPKQLRPAPGPPDLRSGLYVRDYNEVKDLGSLNSTLRTQEQTELAIFFSDNFLTMIQRMLRGFADDNVTDLGDNARMFALAEMAAADALISAWESKTHYNFWRPITAIREGENDGNPRTAGDPAWTPFLATPPYPEYTSGANNLINSIMRTLEHIFRTERITFTVESKAAGAVNGGFNFRTYDRFSDMAHDVIDARIYQGIHFRFGDEVAYRQGQHSADWAFSHFLRPLQ